MNVYLIRHGETEHNKLNEVHQTFETPLSQRGIQQSEQLAKHLTSFPLEIILTSPMQRALQTATIIAEKKSLPFVTTELLHERKQPSEIEGKPYTDPQVKRIKALMEQHKDDPTFYFSDEERFEDIKNRAGTFLRKLESRKEQNIAIVTHRHFLRMLLGVMAFGKDYPLAAYIAFDHFMYTENASVTHCRWQKNRWQLLSFNDVSYASV
ncbi:MAG: histidine phosphatase family protein [Candidatus Levyibacteriota bacterium]